MEKDERTQAIDNFLVEFEEMIRAANAITDFKFKIGVTITSRNGITSDRVRTINAINEIFSRNDMNWESTNIQTREPKLT